MNWKHNWPGIVAVGLVTATTALWTFWGAAEMYYEGWGLPFPQPLAYLIPGAICLLATAIVLAWPRVGGWMLIAGGTLFTAWWWRMQIGRAGGIQPLALLSMFPVSGMLVLTGVLFLVWGRRRRQARAAGGTGHHNWLVRNLRYLAGLGVPLLVLLIVSAVQLPGVLARVDDGNRDAIQIAGNGVTLVWAPAGPGWNWRQPTGWHPSWDHIALYGAPPVGLKRAQAHATQADMDVTNLCRYLSEDGRTLLEEPQEVWRMPTVGELVRSLVRRGENAGCTWDGEEARATCHVPPDKEMPLWATDEPPIYYWAADEGDADMGWYVSYNGWVRQQPKDWANPRHGHRCVREP